MTDIPRTLIICVSLHPISNQQKIDMQKNLVIVESPAKAKTIEKFLGKDYKVMSSYGHIRDLKTKDFSIDLEHNYAPEYVIPSDKKKLVTELKNEAKKAEQVWLASDEDREGEAISWHLYEVLGLKPENTKRIVFHEITKNAILHAIETPRDINIDLVNAQQARRILDRIVGFERTVFALPKFTIPDDKKLVVEMYEKQGGRHQIFEVDNEDLVRAETINELQVR